jgi:cation diffusion facilitator family transporter
MARVTAKRTVWTSFIVDGLDIGLNVTMMIITGSVVLLAEALEGGSDLLASGLLLIGLRISKKRPDTSHPFGYGKALYSWTLISALVMLIFGAGLSFYFGLKRFLQPHDIQHIGLAFVALGISIISNGYALSVSTRRLLNSQSLNKLKEMFLHSTHVETKNTFVLDFTGACAALIGFVAIILYQITGIRQLDGLGGMFMGTVIAICSIFLIWGVKDFLSGKGARPEIVEHLKKVVLESTGVNAIHELKTMYLSSNKLLVHLDIVISKSLKASDIEKLKKELKTNLKKTLKIVSAVQIEIISTQ